MRYFSMFSGVGGFEKGIERAYERYMGAESANKVAEQTESEIQLRRERATLEKEHGILSTNKRWGRPICIGYSEIDKYAIQTYERQFNGVGDSGRHIQESTSDCLQKTQPNAKVGTSRQLKGYGGHTNYGDATKINPKELPDFDLLVGGFPCQAFSIAGKRKGFDDTRGTLFFDIARILSEKRPRHLVLENVKGLLSHDSGKTFQTILGVLADLGYRVEWQVLNSKDFGVPQNRERVYFVGHLRGECSGKVFPITGSSQQIASVAGYISEEVWPNRHEQIRRTYNTDGAMPTIPTGQGGGVMTKIVSKTIRSGGRKSPHGSKQNWDSYEFSGRIRRLTPTECERLQGFPDGWTDSVSDTQRYKQCGNAVSVPVVEAVMTNLIKEMEG